MENKIVIDNWCWINQTELIIKYVCGVGAFVSECVRACVRACLSRVKTLRESFRDCFPRRFRISSIPGIGAFPAPFRLG